MNTSELTEPENRIFFWKFSNFFKLESMIQSYTSNNGENFTGEQNSFLMLL